MSPKAHGTQTQNNSIMKKIGGLPVRIYGHFQIVSLVRVVCIHANRMTNTIPGHLAGLLLFIPRTVSPLKIQYYG